MKAIYDGSEHEILFLMIISEPKMTMNIIYPDIEFIAFNEQDKHFFFDGISRYKEVSVILLEPYFLYRFDDENIFHMCTHGDTMKFLKRYL